MISRKTATKTQAQIVGQMAEDKACDYLLKKGLKLVTRNYRCRLGEIDLIMIDKHNLVFVEVRYRKPSRFGDAAETVNYHKQQKLIKAATHYIQYKSVSMACRFDVISMMPRGEELDIEWIKDAFEVEY
jgi:putative endonuclease